MSHPPFEHKSILNRVGVTRWTKSDRISSFLVNQALRQPSKGVSWGVTGVYFRKGPEAVVGKTEVDLQEIGLSGLRHSLSAAAHVELGEDVVDVLFDGACGEDELLRDVLVGEPGGDQAKHIACLTHDGRTLQRVNP